MPYEECWARVSEGLTQTRTASIKPCSVYLWAEIEDKVCINQQDAERTGRLQKIRIRGWWRVDYYHDYMYVYIM